MLHDDRVWCLNEIESPEELAKLLTQYSMVMCAGAYVKGHPTYLFLNDSISADGAGEYAVVKRAGDTFIQVETITFSWCSLEKGLEYITEILAGEYDEGWFTHEIKVRVQSPQEHGFCHHCR